MKTYIDNYHALHEDIHCFGYRENLCRICDSIIGSINNKGMSGVVRKDIIDIVHECIKHVHAHYWSHGKGPYGRDYGIYNYDKGWHLLLHCDSNYVPLKEFSHGELCDYSLSVVSFVKIKNCNKPAERVCGGKPLEGYVLSKQKENRIIGLLKFTKRIFCYGLHAFVPQRVIQVGPVVYKTLTDRIVTVSHCLDSKVENVVIPESIVAGGTTYRVVRIEPKAFQNCNLLDFLILPSTIRSIGRQAFEGCPLRNLIFYGAIQPKICKNAFDMSFCGDAGRDIYLPNMKYCGIEKGCWGCGWPSNDVRTHYNQGADMCADYLRETA